MAKAESTPEVQSSDQALDYSNRDDSGSKPSFNNHGRSINPRDAGEPGFDPAVSPDSDQELYTIPNYSSWFSWEDIHETERSSLKEFFDGSSPSRTPKIYKEYRDFIINKYREDPTRSLTYTELRRMIIGDVNLIRKVFVFLETWGLINFQTSDNGTKAHSEETQLVNLEEGLPAGIRVISDPNATKGVSASNASERVENGLKLPPLTSYLDVFGERIHAETELEAKSTPSKELVCHNCGEECKADDYSCLKGGFIFCAKCVESKNDGEGESTNVVKLNNSIDDGSEHGNDAWTDAEVLLLLDAVLKHGDDWNLVVQHVQTRSKFECISKLIQLPFGEHVLAGPKGKTDGMNSASPTDEIKQHKSTSGESQEAIKTEDWHYEQTGETKQIATSGTSGPPLKRRCIISFADAGSSLMSQVALLSTAVGPHIAAVAAEAALEALCDENPNTRKMLSDDEKITYNFGAAARDSQPERALKVEDCETEERHKQSGNLESHRDKRFGPSTVQIRAAIATSFGAAAAHSKLLADQEDREIEHLMATIIEIQLRKINYKIKRFEELELIMEKEYTHIQELKETILMDRIDVLQETFDAGLLRWRDQNFMKFLTGL